MKYRISSIDDPLYGESVGNDAVEYDPENAIIQWFRFSEKYPTCTSIQPETKEDGVALLKWAKANFDKLKVWAKEYSCPYKTEWLKEQVETQLNSGKCSMQWEYDQLFPFCMG